MFRLRILTFCTVVCAALIFFFKKRIPSTIAAGEGLVIKNEWLINTAVTKIPSSDIRPGDQTFLTFPEWYLVFSPEEQAQYFEKHTATGFPFMDHTRQIWDSYDIVKDQIRDNFPPNDGYHFMIRVIGSSATAEYSFKALYETLIGRITDTRSVETVEDKFNAKFTREYVDFIKDLPWYQFDFKSQLGELWRNNSLIGNHPLRKLERRYLLTSELLVKWGYGKLIGLGTAQVYEEALLTTAVVTGSGEIIHLPRYDRFAIEATKLARDGITFTEIAGNNTAIMMSLLVPAEWVSNLPGSQLLFTQPVASNHSKKRVVVVTRVNDLAALLRRTDDQHLEVEHVFDF
ncbi:MAG: hypothetical protein ABW036_08300 [Flavitalea sp.]